MKVRESIPTLGRESGFVDVYARAPLPNAVLSTLVQVCAFCQWLLT